MKKIILNWKPQESWIKDLFDDDYKEIAMKIADFIKPTSFKELGDLYHGENKYHFFPDFSQWVNKGVDSIKECITALSSQETNTYFQEYMLELTPDVFRPFMEGVFNSGIDPIGQGFLPIDFPPPIDPQLPVDPSFIGELIDAIVKILEQ
jgi:hypothetical protein